MYEQRESGLYAPRWGRHVGQKIKVILESPLMEFLTFSALNSWVVDEENGMTAWNLPVYTKLALIQQVTMRGVDLIQKVNTTSQSKGLGVTSMMVRGINLARLTCFSLAFGSFSDAFANYRMLLDRHLTLLYLDSNNQYEDFAKAFYAEKYHRVSKGINDEELRKGYSLKQINESKQMMYIIRKTYFNGNPPNAPGHYWKPPTTQQLADEYVNSTKFEPETIESKEILRVYDLGNKSVHPQLRDMLQPEDSDIEYEDLTDLTLLTVSDISKFGLSRFERVISTCKQSDGNSPTAC